MANSAAVWGIDIGRCALKALRCRVDGDSVVADGFDYIEYPKLLTQPEADAPQLVKEALDQFLLRNTLKGDKVAVSVPGESGLARYFKPPPVDVKKIADIVKYEARQQIPFALEDVIWDFQRMAGGQEVDGFALDTEIGLFAMKKEAIAKQMAPYNAANIEIDIIQLAPIAIYNYIAHDVAKELPEGQEYSSESPPPSLVVLSIGTDTTDLVVTNGYRVWQRNIPLGGNHFTKQLSKELKLTFAKAEHLKRNPKQAEDPKAIFQAMRPVFADMVTEVQRSIGFFQSLDRKAKIGKVVMLGNTVKLPGLVQYLSKHLGYDVQEIDSFNKLGGSTVVTAPSFKDNVLAFSTCYGLCLQGLNKGKLGTNLLPREILTQRMIRAKKPWALAGVAAMLLACALNYTFWYNRWWEVNPENEVNGVKWSSAISNAGVVNGESKKWIGEDETKKADLDRMQKIGREVVGSADRRVLWLEMMKALNKSLPPMVEGLDPRAPTPDFKTLPFDQRKDLKISHIETQFFPELSTWFTELVKEKYVQVNPELLHAPPGGAAPTDGSAPAAPAGDVAAAPAPDAGAMPVGGGEGGGMGDPNMETGPQTDLSGVSITGPSGPGWVVELLGYHFYSKGPRQDIGSAHVEKTLLRNLKEGFVEVPDGPGKPAQRYTMKELGIGYAILAHSPIPRPVDIPNPNYVPPVGGVGGVGGEGGLGGLGGPGGIGGGPMGGVPGAGLAPIDPDNPPSFRVTCYDFAVQFVWQEKPLNVRIEERRLKKEADDKAAAEKAAAAAAPAGEGDAAAPGTPPAGAEAGQPAVVPGPMPPAGPGGGPAPLAVPPSEETPADASAAPVAPAPGGTAPAAAVPAPAGGLPPGAAPPVIPPVPDAP
jgi:type IV pilus assembly protein PilM